MWKSLGQTLDAKNGFVQCEKLASYSERKMCVVIQIPQNFYPNTSWQGDPLRAPVASPQPWLFWALNPSRATKRIAVSPLAREPSALPCTPSAWGRSCPQNPRPLHGDDFIESKGRSYPYAILTRKGAVALPFLGTIPSTKDASLPWNPDQPCADWMPPSCQRWIMIKGRSAAPRKPLWRGVDIR